MANKSGQWGHQRQRSVARAYRDFLETFYRGPSVQTRSRPITETIAVCQVAIDNGAIAMD